MLSSLPDPIFNSKQQRLLGELEKMPIIQVACNRASIGRATYYRWREDVQGFEDAADLALAKGEDMINDMAEAKLIELIKADSFWAIRYWLSRHHYRYTRKPIAPLPYRRKFLRSMRDLW